MNVDYPGAVAAFVDRGRVFQNARPKFAIILHKTGGGDANVSAHQDLSDLAHFFATNPEEKSSHYGIGRDGEVYQFVSEQDGAGANCCVEAGYDTIWSNFVESKINLNLVTLSIEHLDDQKDNSTPLTEPQKMASFKLVKHLCDKHDIPHDHVLGHNTIDPESRAHCPGNYPWAELKQFLSGDHPSQTEGKPVVVPEPKVSVVPKGWTWDASSKTLVAKNGLRVLGDMALFILNGEWNSDDVPSEEEHAADPIELYGKLDNNIGTLQYFTFSGLAKRSNSTEVFRVPVGSELMHLRSTIAEWNAKLLAAENAQKEPVPVDNSSFQAQIDELGKEISMLRNAVPFAEIDQVLVAAENLVQKLIPLKK